MCVCLSVCLCLCALGGGHGVVSSGCLYAPESAMVPACEVRDGTEVTPLPALAPTVVRVCTRAHTPHKSLIRVLPSPAPADPCLFLLHMPSQLDVYLFLFSDVLLVTKPQRKADKAKVIRPPLMLEKLVCQPLRDPSTSLLWWPFPSPFLLVRGRNSQDGHQIRSSP